VFDEPRKPENGENPADITDRTRDTVTKEGRGLDGVCAILLPASVLAEHPFQDRLQQLRELGLHVDLTDGDGETAPSLDPPLPALNWLAGSATKELSSGPEHVLVLTIAGQPNVEVAAGSADVVAVERPADALLLLDRLIEVKRGFPQPVEDQAWLIELEGFDPYREREVESWLAVGNGRTGTRGSLEELSEYSAPGCYVAGVYGWPEREPPGPELVTGPQWTVLAPRLEEEPLELERGHVISHRRVLDMRQAILFRSWRQRLDSGIETRFRSARFASLAERELLALEAGLETDGAQGDLDTVLPEAGGPASTSSVINHDGVLQIEVAGRDGGTARFAVASQSTAGQIERLVAVSRAPYGETHDTDAAARVMKAGEDGIATIRARHCVAWRERWRGADVIVEGDPQAQRALRFAIYHLISAADPDSDVASVPARALTGPGYRGHVFWDTEVFVHPFFCLTHPDTARELLRYRARTLPAARQRAHELGYRGALYAWESADTGDDVTPSYLNRLDGKRTPILTGRQEHHISADIAWAVWRYWEWSGDDAFLADVGAEIIIEAARFWASRARLSSDGHYHIGPVIGPDEYHEGVRNNAFTNNLARWNLERALELVQQAGPAGLGAKPHELRRWRALVTDMSDGFDPVTGLYEQFEGFFELEDLRAAELAPPPFPADAVLGSERVRRSQLVKQADVLMLTHMLPELVPLEVTAANYNYYEPRTSHGSSLSPAVHAAVAARIGNLDQALAYFRMAASIDLGDAIGSSAQGIHIATMGGLWQATVLGFGGVRLDRGVIRLAPRLPSAWRRLAFPIRWHGKMIFIDVRPTELRVRLDGTTVVALADGPAQTLRAGNYRASVQRGGWSALREE
jgi:kojibiose phosphorylase